MKKIITILLFFISGLSFSQTKNADLILNNIKTKLGKVNDYSANVEVSVKMDFLKMPNSKAEIFFKKPDKFKFNSSGFAILPKAGFDFNPQKILEHDITAKIVGDTLFDNKLLKIIEITPNVDSLKFSSAVLFIDDVQDLISQIYISADRGMNITTKFKYGEQYNYALPSEINVNFDLSNSVEDDTVKKGRTKIPNNFKGDINIKYSNYKINLGIDDSVFLDEEKITETKE